MSEKECPHTDPYLRWLWDQAIKEGAPDPSVYVARTVGKQKARDERRQQLDEQRRRPWRRRRTNTRIKRPAEPPAPELL